MIYNLNDWPEGHVGHLVPSEEVVNAFIEINKTHPIRNVLEFGFNTVKCLTGFDQVHDYSINMRPVAFSARRHFHGLITARHDLRHNVRDPAGSRKAGTIKKGDARSVPFWCLHHLVPKDQASCSAMNFSASRAAMQPMPAAVTA